MTLSILMKTKGEIPVTKQLINKYNELNGGTILGVQEVPEKEVDKYGIIDPLNKVDDKTVEVENFVEKRQWKKLQADVDRTWKICSGT